MREQANAPLQLGAEPSIIRPPRGRTDANGATNRGVKSFIGSAPYARSDRIASSK
jgi:hypothetical protein